LPNGEEIYCSHSVTPLIEVDGHQLPQKLAVIELEEYDGILGNDFFRKFDMLSIDYRNRSASLARLNS
jgi:hypothetical protein